jgi:hypothetical protein
VQEELLGVRFCHSLVECSESDGRDLEDGDDDDEESIGGEEDSGLFDGTAVTEEGDDEDEGASGDQDVSALLDDSRLS